MFTHPGTLSQPKSLTIPERGFAIWLTAFIAVVVCGLFFWIHFENERAIRGLAAASSAVSEARVNLSEAFVNLSLHEIDTDGGYRLQAAERLKAADEHIDVALKLYGDAPAHAALQARLSTFRDRIAAWIPQSLRTNFSDEALADAFAFFSTEAVGLDSAAQALVVASGARLDVLFVRTVAGMVILLAGIVSIVIVAAAAHRRSTAAQRRAEAHAGRQAKLLTAIAEGTTDAVFVKDREGRYLYANHATAAFVGKPVSDMVGRDDTELFEPDSAAALRRHDRLVMDENRTDTSEEIATAAGVTRTYLVTKGPLHDEQGNVIGIIGVSRDISARKRDEQALRESETRLELALAAARMGVWSIDLKKNTVFWSPELYEMTGRTAAPAGFEEFLTLVLPEDRESVRKAVETAIRSRTPHRAIFRFRRPDGEIRWLSHSGEGSYDADGTYIGMRGAMFDITDRMVMEEALRTSEEKYRHFLDLLPDAVFLNEDDRVAYCNPAYLALRGAADASQVIGTSVFDMFPPEAHDLIRQRIEAHRKEGRQVAPEERQLLRLDGRTVPVLVAALPLVDPTRKSILVVLRDLSSERHANEWAQSILNHTLDGIMSIDQQGTITSFNIAAEQIFGYLANEVLGRHISMLLPSARPADLGRRLETQAMRKDGTTVEVDIALSAFDLGGERHVIAVVRDRTERRKLETELRQAHKMEALGQVASGVAHDFNNLLTVILGYSDILQEQLPEGDRRRQYAADIRRASGRAADLTRQLLTFSRRSVVAPKVVDVNAVVKDMNRMLRRVLGEDVELTVVAELGARPVLIDPGSLEQIVMNLCVNARDAMPKGGRITVTTSQCQRGDGVDAAGNPIVLGDYVTVTVADTGEGIPADVRPHIFEPFFTTKGAGKGTGLGLAVVQGLVAQNGGHILLESAPHKGTTFTVALPAVDTAVAAPEMPVRPPRGGGETILVVEDEEPVRRLAIIALSEAGYRVLEAPDGRAALDVFEQHRGYVDLVVTDVVMPNLGGRELVLSLNARQPALPVIYTSGYTDDAVLRHGISHAEVPFLAKPYTPTSLLQKVRDVIDQMPARLSASPRA